MAIHRIRKSVASRIANSSAKKMMPKRIQNWAVAHIDTLTATSSNNVSDNSSSRNNTPNSDSTAFKLPESSSSSLPVLELNMDRATKMTTRSCLKKTPQPVAQPKREAQANCMYSIYSIKDDNSGSDTPKKRVAFLPDASLMTCMRTGMHLLPEVKTAETAARFLERSERRMLAEAAYKAARHLERAAFPSSSDDPDSEEEAGQQDKVEDAHAKEERIALEEIIDDMGPFDAEEQAVTDTLQRARDNAEDLTVATVTGGGMDFALYVARTADRLASLESIAVAVAAAAQGATRIASYPRSASEWWHVSHGLAMDRAAETTRLVRANFEDYENSMTGGRALMRARFVEATIKPAKEEPEKEEKEEKEKEEKEGDNNKTSGSGGEVGDLIMPTASLSLDPAK